MSLYRRSSTLAPIAAATIALTVGGLLLRLRLANSPRPQPRPITLAL